MYYNFDNTSFFNSKEFDSPDMLNSGRLMQHSFLDMLQTARIISDIPYIITSGYRTPNHNKKVNGSIDSSHLVGLACDIKTTNSRERFYILQGLFQADFSRIGIHQDFIHVDNDISKPQEVVWMY